MPEDDKRKPDAGVKTQSSQKEVQQEASQKEVRKSDEAKATNAQTQNAAESSNSSISNANKTDKTENTNNPHKADNTLNAANAEPKQDVKQEIKSKSESKSETKPEAKIDTKLAVKDDAKDVNKAEKSTKITHSSALNKQAPLIEEKKPSEEKDVAAAKKSQTKTNSKLSSKYDMKQKDAAKDAAKDASKLPNESSNEDAKNTVNDSSRESLKNTDNTANSANAANPINPVNTANTVKDAVKADSLPVKAKVKAEVKHDNTAKKPQKQAAESAKPAKPVIAQDYLFDFAMTQSRISKESEDKAKDESVKLTKSQSHDGANRKDVDEEISKDIARKIVESVVESVVESFVESVQMAEMAEIEAMKKEKPNDSDVESSSINNINAEESTKREEISAQTMMANAEILAHFKETISDIIQSLKKTHASFQDALKDSSESFEIERALEETRKAINEANTIAKTINDTSSDIDAEKMMQIKQQIAQSISESSTSSNKMLDILKMISKDSKSDKSDKFDKSDKSDKKNKLENDKPKDVSQASISVSDTASSKHNKHQLDDVNNQKPNAESSTKDSKYAKDVSESINKNAPKHTDKPIEKQADKQAEKQIAEKQAKKERQKMPMIALRDIVAFPKTITPLFIGRAKSVAGAESVTSTTNTVFLCSQKDAAIEKVNDTNLYQVGCVGKIVQCVSIPNGALKVLVDVLYKAKMVKCLDNGNFFEAEVEKIFESEEDQSEQTIIALRRAIIEALENYSVFTKKENESTSSLAKIVDHREFVGMLVSSLPADNKAKQQILESKDLISTLESILLILMQESEILKADKLIKEKVEAQIKKNNKEYYLNEQVKAIKQELGESDSVTGAADKYEKLLPTINFTAEARAKAEEEIRRLRTMNAMSSENTRAYLDMLFAIPWAKYDKGNSDILHSIKVLMNSHYGLEKVKESVLEYLAVQMNNENSKGAILCLYGPPGVGKTTLVKSIAEAMGRKYAKISLGGVRDEAEIRGHRRTYVGAMPGKLVQTIKRLGVCNPVILLDEIDKVGRDHRGDPESALLEVLDPDQNSTFQDHYLEIGYDLSRVMFVTTANDFSSMSRPLLDRLEVVNVSGYLEHEKIEICKNHIIKKQIENIGIPADKFSISTDAIRDIIKYYTREAGVRELDRLIGKTVRKGLICQMAKQEGMEMEIDGFREMFAKSILPKMNQSASTTSSNAKNSADSDVSPVSVDSGASIDSSDLVNLTNEKVVKFSENDAPIEVTSANLARFLGTKKYTRHTPEKEDLIGVTNGLAYTESGGDVLLIEAVKLSNSKGGVTITGRLGEVMKESAEMVVGYVKSRAEDFGINLENLSKQGIHIHFPDGATPKDGPSAGIAICTTIVSLLSGIGVKHNIAMTGEITLRGRVLPIGGLREKLVAALRNGIDTVLLPKENEKDLQEVPSHVKDNLKIILCSHIDEVLEHALMDKPFVTGYKPRMSIIEDSGMLLIQ